MKFLHMSDLHLGAPVRGFVDLAPEWAARLQRAIPEAYDRAIDAAIARAVDFVVIAGDAFDTSKPSYGDYLRFFEGLERLDAAGIPSYLVAGNHDPYTTWARDVERLPGSAHLLGVDGPEFALFSRQSGDGNAVPECLIAGRSYHNQTWPADQPIAGGISRAAAAEALGTDAPFAIGVIHTGLDIDTAKAPADQAKLLDTGIDYWACGHLHQRLVRPTPDNPRVVFPGCLQARDIKETGERGCYLVELEQGAPPHLEFIPTSSVVFQQLEVDVGACQTLADLVHLVQARLFRENGQVHCDEMIVRVTLTGATALHGFLLKSGIMSELRNRINDAYPGFFCDALVRRTTPADEDTTSPFPQVVREIAAEESARETVLINYVQNELVKRGIAVPSSLSHRVGEFNATAEALVLDLLRESDDE
ncbi:MAG: exonuclease SbcCD subunit D [Eggerthellaceae bacterium]|nr:exonuclease SbcCD subunit D [Eggerthellaceae bacterium]